MQRRRLLLALVTLWMWHVAAQVEELDVVAPMIADPIPSHVDSSRLNQLDVQAVEEQEESSRSFILSLLMIIVSEIGDKTFLIAAIMAMKHSRFLIFSAAWSALAVMSILSAFLGHAVPNLVPRRYTIWLAALLFFVFGIKMMYEGYHMSGEEQKEEMAEVEEELLEKEHSETLREVEEGTSSDTVNTRQSFDDIDDGVPERRKVEKMRDGLVNLCQLLFSPTFVQTFVMTFLAEWGDRSQIATIALASASNAVYWVTIGTILGHAACTGMAVVGGRMLAQRISVRTVTLAGSVLFIGFALVYVYEALVEVEA
ncbi:hypothetical protein BZG36_00300 [Bifiguratus adelaidae]|uniref:GDT1 family protein n=1 Tax=Bifiguratus adelaidae TaxID=1938954 RepID=A0A261Y802_9FUNG|nr:hypothetical protein BZG36_00300 [Bifiguratus adelaidae]